MACTTTRLCALARQVPREHHRKTHHLASCGINPRALSVYHPLSHCLPDHPFDLSTQPPTAQRACAASLHLHYLRHEYRGHQYCLCTPPACTRPRCPSLLLLLSLCDLPNVMLCITFWQVQCVHTAAKNSQKDRDGKRNSNCSIQAQQMQGSSPLHQHNPDSGITQRSNRLLLYISLVWAAHHSNQVTLSSKHGAELQHVIQPVTTSDQLHYIRPAASDQHRV